MGQSQAKPKPHPLGRPNLGYETQKRVQASSGRSGKATAAERVFGAPGRNRAEIVRIIRKYGPQMTKEVNFTVDKFDSGITVPLVNPIDGIKTFVDTKGMVSFFDGPQARRQHPMRKDLISNELLNKMRELARTQPRVQYVDTARGQQSAVRIPDTDKSKEYLAKANILRVQAKRQMTQFLIGRVPAGASLERRLQREERKYQELLQGFRSGWIFGTAFVSVKQGIERIMNSPVLRKAYLETFANVVQLIPVIGPLMARVMRAAAVDMNFDTGDFLRELFKEGVATVFEIMAMAALGAVLPPGTSAALRRVASFGARVVSKEVGSRGAGKIVKDANKAKKELDEKAKQSVQKVAG